MLVGFKLHHTFKVANQSIHPITFGIFKPMKWTISQHCKRLWGKFKNNPDPRMSLVSGSELGSRGGTQNKKILKEILKKKERKKVEPNSSITKIKTLPLSLSLSLSLTILISLSMTAPCPVCDVIVPWAELERYCFYFWETNANANAYWDFLLYYCCCSFPLISLVNALAAGMLTVTLNWKMSSKSKNEYCIVSDLGFFFFKFSGHVFGINFLGKWVICASG